MPSPSRWTFCVTATLLSLSLGCESVNRIYDQDTGTVERVPPPPAYTPEPAPIDDPAAVEFVDNDPASDPGQAIQPLPEPEASPQPEPVAQRTYTIKKGDNFWKIAEAEYGDPVRMQDILKANPGVDPNRLQIGDEIILPE
jgi:nucleoid-associated protein YgaU